MRLCGALKCERACFREGREGGDSAAVRFWIRRCGTLWRLGVYSGASRGEIAGAARIGGRNGGRAESRVDFGLISISAEPVSDFHLGRAGTGMSIRRAGRERPMQGFCGGWWSEKGGGAGGECRSCVTHAGGVTCDGA